MGLSQMSDAVEILAKTNPRAPIIMLQLYLAYIRDYAKDGLSFC